MSKVIIYTDGGARGNPGPAGAGVVIADEQGNVLKEISQFLGTRTNNWAEYQAIILGLQYLKKFLGKEKLQKSSVEVHTDSELVVKQLRGEYQVKKETLFSQFIAVNNMRVTDFPNITFTHVRREKNKKADKLANDAMDRGENSKENMSLSL
ncbi:hypothetical protein CL630_03060 [bacterium]|nr:hypothetical protein [bacterium]|tara:strand:- start:25060 stop:25515 length:456 start_codon:yes stop_codon:yes gene_type:complete